MAFSNKVINGTDITLSIDGSTVACATSHSIEISMAVREVACKDTPKWTKNEVSRLSWTASIDALVNLYIDTPVKSIYTSFLTAVSNQTKVAVVSTYTEGETTFTQTGTAIITSVSMNAADNENASLSVSLVGDGELVSEVV